MTVHAELVSQPATLALAAGAFEATRADDLLAQAEALRGTCEPSWCRRGTRGPTPSPCWQRPSSKPNDECRGGSGVGRRSAPGHGGGLPPIRGRRRSYESPPRALLLASRQTGKEHRDRCLRAARGPLPTSQHRSAVVSGATPGRRTTGSRAVLAHLVSRPPLGDQ